ncbi:hypothetical protein Q1695_010714 [Nippostrongylus brasiliensis]|nr:hypothetical protein Q1695_010714 [Nippostrongylus brasiliensis]
METTRNRKSKTKQRTSIRDVPPPSSREAVVMGMRLPDVPQHKPHRATTPEPEELILSDDEQQSTSTAAVGSVTSSYSDAPPANFGESEDADMTSSSSARTTVFEPLCYPSIPQLSDNTVCCASAIATPVHEEIRQDIIAESSITPQAPVVDAPSFYPSLSKKHFEKDRHDLLTEQHLLTFYHNPFYMISEELTNKFVQGNMVPCGPLFPLLKRLKSLCDQMVLSEAKEKENVSSISKCLHDCWTVQQQTFESRGKCGENKEASGVGCFYKSVLCIEKVDELKNLLAANRTYLLDEQICQESQFRATALQIQWIVMSINQQFFEEHGLSVHSPPTLVENAIVSSGRTLLLNSLSDIFFYLRFPSLTKRFADSLTGWAVELVCVLYKWCRCEDGQFVLNHLLRLPSPISEWAAPLLQTFIQAPSPPKVKVDHCVTMLSLLMNPISARDLFLCRLTLSETEDSSWAILSNDEEEGDFSFATISEIDLACFLEQLPISELYSLTYLCFSSSSANKGDQMMSLIAFQLLLMKILNTGLSTYCSLSYKSFCKRIGNSLRQSVRELCNHWTIARNSSQLEQDSQIQQEVDRIVLLAVHYITTRPGFGLWQFLVDLPYDVVSQNCRIRCEYLLRSTQDMELSKIYDIPISEVVKSNRTGGLKERTESIGSLDSVFLVNTLAAIVSYSLDDASYLVKELVDVCFCDGVSRDTLYKVGSEAISLLLSRRPSTFDQLLTVLDRNMTHMDNYAVDVLASSNLSACKLTPATLSVLGKWLINEPPDHPANRVARRVMSSLYWGPNETGDQLWLDAGVHTIAADTVMKAHSIHCGRSNGMISKSIKKISKLASNIPNHEQLFSQFCWDILIKMKITAKENSNPPPNDLSAFFIHVAQSHLTNASVFLERGVPLMIDLIASGCSTACVVLLAKLMASHYTEVNLFGSNKAFMELFDRVLHIDQCSFAVQWLVGPSSEPTPIVRLICSSISYYSKHVQDVAEYLRAWVDLLCAKRPNFWNNDNATLQVLGSIARIAFLIDRSKLLGIPDIIFRLYEQVLSSWRENSRGILSMFTADQAPPPLIASSMLRVAPWASYLLLLVESKCYRDFYQHLYECLAKKENSTVEEAVKKAASKSALLLPINRLIIYRWAEFVSILSESAVLPLAVQRLATEAYHLVTVQGAKYCFARRFLDAVSPASILLSCQKVLTDANDPKGLYKAVSGWLFCSHEVTRRNFDFSVFDLDYLLQLILHDDTNIWMDFVDIVKLTHDEKQEEKLFALTCHLGPKDPIQHVSDKFSNKSRDSRAVGFPILPTHPCLPPAPYVDRSAIFHPNSVVDMIDPLIKRLRTLAKDYVTSADSMASEDVKFVDLVTKLHSSVVQQAPVQLRCGTRCASPYNTTIQVTSTKFNESIDAQMTYNREQRSGLLSEMRTCVLDRTAIASATFEHIARLLVRISVLHSSSYKANAQLTGGAVLKLVTSSLSGDEMLFPAAIATYEHTVRMLAEEFVRMQSQQQIPVMVLVLEGFPLSDPLIEAFTPECLSSSELCAAYTRLSEAVRDQERSSRALKLLKRLGMDKAAASLPPQQFVPLLPLAFRNLISQTDSSAPLHILCMEHFVTFVFHAFPANFLYGLDMALDGCSTGETPSTLLQAFVERLGAVNYEGIQGQYVLSVQKANECASLLAERLSQARSRSSSMFAVWGRYLDAVTRLAQLFLFTPTREAFPCQAPPVVVQRDFDEIFQRVLAVFSPLLVPTSPSVPPFSPLNENEAHLVLERFVDLLSAFPHNSVLVPGTHENNLPSLVWQFYFGKLSRLSHGATHFFPVIERHFVRIAWASFYPTGRSLSTMNDCLVSRSPCCAPLVAQIVVRIMWKDVLGSHVGHDMLSSYLSTLFCVLVRLGSMPSNYEKVRASMLNLVKSLSQRDDWSTISPEHAREVANVVSVALPYDTLSNPSDVVSVLHNIWRKICCFIVREPFSSDTLLKQTIWLRTECDLVIRGGATAAPSSYNSLIADVDVLAKQHENLRAFSVVARELIAVWSRVSDAKLGESLVATWTGYLATNFDSPLVLLSMNTLLGSLNIDQVATALKVMEKTIRVYFRRNSVAWSELMQWTECPLSLASVARDYVLGVSGSNNSDPLMLTASWLMKFLPPSDTSVSKLHDFVLSIKPRHVRCEASFLLLIWQEMRWLADSAVAAHANHGSGINERLFDFMQWLKKAAKDESSFIMNLITSKKTAHSPRLRVVLTILELYLTQQALGETHLPRTSEGAPVLNSRISGLKEAASTAEYQHFAAAFNVATPYFVQADVHHIGSAPNLVIQCSKALFEEKFLSIDT